MKFNIKLSSIYYIRLEYICKESYCVIKSVYYIFAQTSALRLRCVQHVSDMAECVFIHSFCVVNFSISFYISFRFCNSRDVRNKLSIIRSEYLLQLFPLRCSVLQENIIRSIKMLKRNSMKLYNVI